MTLFFSLTTPVGIIIGIGILKFYDENGFTSLIVEGIFNVSLTEILIYMALVDLVATNSMKPRRHTFRWLQVGVNITLLLSAKCMSLLAEWVLIWFMLVIPPLLD